MLTLCDIDGVIGDPCSLVKTYLMGPNKDWKTYFKHTLDIKPILEVINVVEGLMLWSCQRVIFGTGRPESNRELTERWLNMHLQSYIRSEALRMRTDGDWRTSAEIKLEWAYELHPTLIIEDEPATIELLRKYNFVVLQVHGYRLESADQVPA